jgi:hypothetical protein
MPYHEFLWLDVAIRKIRDNGLTVEEVEHAVLRARLAVISDSSGRPGYKGRTPSGEVIFVAFEVIDPVLRCL